MLRAYHSMPAQDFIAQLRTYVIAMGLSTAVVDCVDNLTGTDDLIREHEKDLQALEDSTEAVTKTKILKAVKKWFDENEGFSEAQRNSLLLRVECT
jgi:hypothetical protein